MEVSSACKQVFQAQIQGESLNHWAKDAVSYLDMQMYQRSRMLNNLCQDIYHPLMMHLSVNIYQEVTVHCYSVHMKHLVWILMGIYFLYKYIYLVYSKWEMHSAWMHMCKGYYKLIEIIWLSQGKDRLWILLNHF